MAVMLFLGGVQLVAIGVLGEYIGRMFDETKGRPLYLLNAHLPGALGADVEPETISGGRRLRESARGARETPGEEW